MYLRIHFCTYNVKQCEALSYHVHYLRHKKGATTTIIIIIKSEEEIGKIPTNHTLKGWENLLNKLQKSENTYTHTFDHFSRIQIGSCCHCSSKKKTECQMNKIEF